MMSSPQSTATAESMIALATVRVIASVPEDGFVYTTGHGQLGRRDLVAVCGGEVDGLQPPLDRGQLSDEVNAAARMVRWIVDHWPRLQVMPGSMFRSDTHRVYKVAEDLKVQEVLDNLLGSFPERAAGLRDRAALPLVLLPIGRVRWH